MKKSIFLIKQNKCSLLTAICCIIFIPFFSCKEKGVNINLPYEPNKIVLNSFILKDSPIYARVTTSSQFNNSFEFPVPDGAKVAIYENFALKEVMAKEKINNDKVYFVSSFKAQEGKKYTLKAFANNMDNAEGSDIVPSSPVLEGISLKKVGDNFKVQIKIKDNVNENNFYRLRVFAAEEVNNQVIVSNYKTYFSIENVDLNGNGVFSTTPEDENYFTDDTFNGQDIVLNLNMDYYDKNLTHIAVKLENLTNDSYKYLFNIFRQVPVGLEPLTEPTIVYNNIKGGYGIVGGMANKEVIIKKQ